MTKGLRLQELLELAALAYNDLGSLCAAERRRDACHGTPDLDHMQDISSEDFGVDAFMARCPERAGVDLVVAVRGTESWKDVIQDLKVCKSGSVDTSCLTRVHCGFLAQAYTLLDPVYKELQAIVGGSEQPRDVVVWLTGHSLGGAVATLLVYMLCNLKKVTCTLKICTFGSPRVGNYFFRCAYEALENVHTKRVCTARDIIGCMPCINYFHVGERLLLHDDTTKRICCCRAPVSFSAHKIDHYRGGLRLLQHAATSI